jgi:FtsZ-binding cell division protein ZapB
MAELNEMEYFKALEEKVGALIEEIRSLRGEREALKEKIRQQEKNISDLSGDMAILKGSRDKAKERIASILQKIEQMDI